MIRHVRHSDAQAIAEVYNHYILNSIITFEEVAVSAEEMLGRIVSISEKYPWLVYEENGILLGYAYASAWKARSAYKNSVESTIYLNSESGGRGIGSILYNALITEIRKGKFHTVIGGIALPNEASIALHEKCGFRKTAHFAEVGYKFEQWIDVAYWQLIL